MRGGRREEVEVRLELKCQVNPSFTYAVGRYNTFPAGTSY